MYTNKVLTFPLRHGLPMKSDFRRFADGTDAGYQLYDEAAAVVKLEEIRFPREQDLPLAAIRKSMIDSCRRKIPRKTIFRRSDRKALDFEILFC